MNNNPSFLADDSIWVKIAIKAYEIRPLDQGLMVEVLPDCHSDSAQRFILRRYFIQGVRSHLVARFC